MRPCDGRCMLGVHGFLVEGGVMRRGSKFFAAAAVLVLVFVGIVVAAALASSSGVQAFPGKNGRIVFNDRTGSLVLVNADGTGLVRLANTRAADDVIGAAFSPNGKLIAYSKAGAAVIRMCS